jgi:hypothetical protein
MMKDFITITEKKMLAALIALLFLVALNLSGQQPIDKEVIVVRTYQPSVAETQKINLLPVLTDTVSVKPIFSYSIVPIPISTDFRVEPITPARMGAETVSKLYGSHIRLGVASYVTPFAELSINSLRNNRYSGGVFLKHHSSQGRLRLGNNEKAYSQFADNQMMFYGKRMGRASILSAEGGLLANNFHYYGYDISIPAELIPERDDIRQQFMTGNAGIRLKSNHTDSAHLNYDLSLDYIYFQDRIDISEHGINFRTGFNKFIRSQVIGADLGIDYYDNTILPGNANRIVQVSPWFNKADDEWEVFAGFHSYHDQRGEESRLYFHPRASLQFSIIRNYVVPYVGIDGGLQVNNHRRVSVDNPFVLPGLNVRNTDRTMDLYAGVKGNFTREIPFNLKVSYAVYQDMYFFVNDNPGLIGNQFNVLYDDVELLTYTGEIGANISDRFSIFTRTNIYSYGMKLLEHPWHRPDLDVTFSGRYNLADKILLNADVFYIGSRLARPVDGSQEPVELKGIADINLGLEYRYNRILSGFIRLNNLTNAKYYKWNNYPLQGFSIMAGFTYSM